MDEVRQQALLANIGESIQGIKKYSCLLNYEFDFVNQTPQDIMHVLHEGVARRLIMKFFQIWIDSKRCSVSEVNLLISNFEYGYTHRKNMIKRFTSSDFKKNSLIISSSQMHTLVLLFPVLFYDILDTSKEEFEYFSYFFF